MSVIITKEEFAFYEKRAAELSEALKQVSFLASIQDPVFSEDISGCITRWNNAAEKLFEWTSEEAVGKNGGQLLKANYLNIDKAEIDNVLKNESLWQGEGIYYAKSGRQINVLMTVSNLKDAEGTIIGNLALMRDITERKKAEDEIIKANKRFQTIFNFSPVSIAITNLPEGEFIYVNDTFCQTTGYTRKDLIGKKSTDVKIIGQEARDKLIAQLLKKESGKDIEETLQRPNGEVVNVLCTAEKIEIDNESCFAFALIDITTRKKTEKALNELNIELERRVIEKAQTIMKTHQEKNMILESIGDAFFAVDENWTVTYWNRIAEVALSVNKVDILGKNLWKIFSDSVDTISFNKYHEAVSTNQVVHFEDYYVALQKWYEISAYPSGNGLSVFFKDISERKKAEIEIRTLNEELEKRVIERTEKLIIANKDLEQFAFIASHDLQEPLRTVSNYMKLFEEEYIEQLDQDAIKYLHSVNNATKRMSSLIKSLLDFSRLGYNTKLAYVDFKTVIDDVIADLGIAIQASNAIIEVSAMPAINIYETEIRQMFQNLIANAIKFRKKDVRPQIKISSEKIKEGWKFSVSDNGIGIAPVHFAQIFDIFQRLETKEKYEGSGIGLANCKKIIQLHQGEIWIESNPEKGSTFHFTIPNLIP